MFYHSPWLVCQVVFWGAAVGDLHPGRVPVSWGARGGTLQAPEGRPSHGPADNLPTGAVGFTAGHNI